ncbi:MAG: hypothetical protein H5U38_06280 [Calditrichaeota bacterium]|nr:hypothetical protein [Calditrichota bacterium]
MERGLDFPIYPHIAIDSIGRVHVVALDDPEDDDLYQDVLYHWWQDDSGWRRELLFRHESQRVTDIGFGFDDQGVLHLVLGISEDPWPWYGFFESIWHMRLERGAWTRMTQIERKDSYADLGFVTLPGGRVAIAWRQGIGPDETILWRLWGDGKWGPSRVAMRRFSPKENGSCFLPVLERGPGDTLHLAFFGEPRGDVWYRAIYYTCRSVHDEWRTPSEVYFNTRVDYDWPTLAITNDGCRHVFWAIDWDRNIFPERILYSYSRDGKTWSSPAPFTHHAFTTLAFHYPFRVRAVADSSGTLHAMWMYYAWPKEMVLFYRSGREENWSEPVPVFPDNCEVGSFDLAVDRQNRLHFVWTAAEGRTPGPGVSSIWHAVAELSKSVVSGRPAPNERSGNSLFASRAAHPNPFNTSCTLRLVVRQPCLKSADIYDVSGRLVRNLVNDLAINRECAVVWDATAQDGTQVPSGVYLYQVKARASGSERQEWASGKLLLVR